MKQQVEMPGISVVSERPLWLNQIELEIEVLFRPESVALIAGERANGLAVLQELARALGVDPVSITEVGLSPTQIQSSEVLLERLDGHQLLFDLEALCWTPWFKLDVLRFLRLHARAGGVVALWPGRITGRVATFSAPSRTDHQRLALTGLSVLHPVATSFPDEVPFKIERIPL